jgi:type IV secretory pathway VirB3-like protein
MATGARSPGGVGCLGTLVAFVVVAAVVVLVVTIGFIALAVFAALLVIGLIVMGVDRLLLALSPKRRERRASQQRMYIWRAGQFGSGPVIDTSVIDTTATLEDPHSETEGPDESPSEEGGTR